MTPRELPYSPLSGRRCLTCGKAVYLRHAYDLTFCKSTRDAEGKEHLHWCNLGEAGVTLSGVVLQYAPAR